MIANPARVLSEQLLHANSFPVKSILQQNRFQGHSSVFNWLIDVMRAQLRQYNSFSFEDNLRGTIGVREVLEAGDTFYKTLLEANNLLGEEDEEQEWKYFPYTNAVKWLYIKFFLRSNDTSLSQPSFVCETLCEQVEKELWAALGIISEFHNYESWMLLFRFYGSESKSFHTYIDTLPQEVILAEITKMRAARQNIPLDTMAYIHGFSRDNEQAAFNYLERLKEVPATPVWNYVYEATRHADTVSLKYEVRLQNKLLKRAGIDSWFRLVDEIGYPLIQLHLLYFLDTLSDYESFVEFIIRDQHSFTTKRDQLLLLTLKSYIGFIESTLQELKGIIKAKETHYYNAEVEQIIQQAKAMYEQWMTALIPQSFKNILNQVFSNGKLSDSLFFIPFFDWVSTYTKDYLDKERLNYKIRLIDLITGAFISRLKLHKEDKVFLLQKLEGSQYNASSLERLVEIAESCRQDDDFVTGLIGKFIQYVRSDQFRWTQPDRVDIETTINQAYHFSLLLGYLNTTYEQWLTIYSEFKFLHEGWRKNQSDYKAYMREAYLLTVGAGLAYYYFNEKQPERANKILFQLLEVVANQFRSGGDYTRVDYETPLCFLTHTVAQYEVGAAERFVQFVVERFDNLKLLLCTISNIYSANAAATLPLSESLKSAIKAKINSDFWVIEEGETGKKQESELKRFVVLKEKCLKFLTA